MARPTLWNHRKFRELTMALKSEALAIGTLECLWRGPYDSGDPLIGSQEAVEHAIYWRGKKGGGAALLLKCGFIDLTPRGYEVHDLLDHAPQYVRTRLQREQKRRQRSISDQSLMRQRSISDEHSRSEHCALSTEPPTPCTFATSVAGSQATDSEQPNSQQPNEPMPPEAREFFEVVAKIGRSTSDRPSVDDDSRRELLRSQALSIVSGGAS